MYHTFGICWCWKRFRFESKEVGPTRCALSFVAVGAAVHKKLHQLPPGGTAVQQYSSSQQVSLTSTRVVCKLVLCAQRAKNKQMMRGIATSTLKAARANEPRFFFYSLAGPLAATIRCGHVHMILRLLLQVQQYVVHTAGGVPFWSRPLHTGGSGVRCRGRHDAATWCPLVQVFPLSLAEAPHYLKCCNLSPFLPRLTWPVVEDTRSTPVYPKMDDELFTESTAALVARAVRQFSGQQYHRQRCFLHQMKRPVSPPSRFVAHGAGPLEALREGVLCCLGCFFGTSAA